MESSPTTIPPIKLLLVSRCISSGEQGNKFASEQVSHKFEAVRLRVKWSSTPLRRLMTRSSMALSHASSRHARTACRSGGCCSRRVLRSSVWVGWYPAPGYLFPLIPFLEVIINLILANWGLLVGCGDVLVVYRLDPFHLPPTHCSLQPIYMALKCLFHHPKGYYSLLFPLTIPSYSLFQRGSHTVAMAPCWASSLGRMNQRHARLTRTI